MNTSKLSITSQLFYDSINSEKQIVSKSDTVKLDTYKKIKKKYEEETGERINTSKSIITIQKDELFW